MYRSMALARRGQVEMHLQDLAKCLDLVPLMKHDCPGSIKFLQGGQVDILNVEI